MAAELGRLHIALVATAAIIAQHHQQRQLPADGRATGVATAALRARAQSDRALSVFGGPARLGAAPSRRH